MGARKIHRHENLKSWIELAEDRDQWRAFVNMAMSLWV
jgi:hypothetical protein